MFLKLILVYCIVQSVVCLYQGDTCTKKDRQDSGTCIVLRDCLTGLEDLANGVQPMICGFQETEPIVCCFNTTSYTKRVSKPTAAPSSRFNNEEVNCRPINPSQTAPKTGRKAFDKCKEYQEKYVYPCERKASLAGGYGRSNNCHHKTDQLISGGEDASLHEFPHMALIGFGMISELDFKCGGSIISERFILTAAHCSSSPQFGPATFVAIGVLRKNEARDQSKIYLIEQFINHPHYRSPSKYDDIALIKTDREMQLNQFTVPACLHTEPEDVSKALATGWGLTQPLARSGAEILQKVILTKFSVEECSDLYKVHRLYRRGFDESTQTCYGDKDMPDSSQGRRTKDTCPGRRSHLNIFSTEEVKNQGPGKLLYEYYTMNCEAMALLCYRSAKEQMDYLMGDSGGPLQIKSEKINCMYIVVGVTSNEIHRCATPGSAGVYTRVWSYIPWIENIVWPSDNSV